MEWLEDTKQSLQNITRSADQKSVSDLVKILGHYRRLEVQLVNLIVDLQASNKILEDIIVKKKSISVTG